jgi:hypothetical protein
VLSFQFSDYDADPVPAVQVTSPLGAPVKPNVLNGQVEFPDGAFTVSV